MDALKLAQPLITSTFAGFLTCFSVGVFAADLVAAGRQIYEQGRLHSGEPLVAHLGMGVRMKGSQGACMQCHRASGSGAFEGGNLVPPVMGPTLFKQPPPVGKSRLPPGFKLQDFHFLTRPPYDSRSLARTLRSGVTPGGHVLSPLMPRYLLNQKDMAALEAYLRQLSSRPSPGINGRVAHFATVITPSANHVDRQGLIDVLTRCFEERYSADSNNGMDWRLHVWDLKGDEPADWPRQLAKYAVERPVFAVVSGLGSADWAPVHQYCEKTHLPCLFPSVDVAGSTEAGRYNFYFSAGTPLEGQVMAHWLLRSELPARLIQLYPGGNDVAVAGAQALAASAVQEGMVVVNRALFDLTPQQLAGAVMDVGPGDALALWLTREQLGLLMKAHPEPPAASHIIASGWLGDIGQLEIASLWRERLRFVYPFDPPVRLEQRMRLNLHPWLHKYRIGPAREVVLGSALTACNLLTEGLAAQRGVLTRDKLIEQIENYPAKMGNAPAPQVFHNFNLGPGQRFSSKGAFVVRFAQPSGNQLEPLGDWIVP